MPKPPPGPSSLKREAAGRYVTQDGRFGVDQASGGWMVTDTEQANELGLPLVRGPFATLEEAREAIEAARTGPGPSSELAARMAATPASGSRGPRGAGASGSRAGSRRRGTAARASRSGSDGPAPATERAEPVPEPPPEPPPVVIRDWRAADGDALRALWAGIGMRGLGDDDAGLVRLARRNPGLVLVATVDREVVGSALGAWDGRRGWIYHVATAPAHRRRGIARQMVERIEERLLKLGCPKVNVIVLDGNGEAAEFWRSIGFAVHPTRQYGHELRE